MVRINLLPHREQKRLARQRQFISLVIGLVILAIGVIGLVHIIIASQIDNQISRNALLKEEIAKLDEQIKEIDKLAEQTRALLARKQIVETLQANRTEAVHVLDQLVRRLPDGLYLKSVRQSGGKITLVGYAQSNARVSTLMRNIEGSPWLTAPELVEIKSIALDKQKLNEFTLNIQLKRAAPPAPAGAAPKGSIAQAGTQPAGATSVAAGGASVTGAPPAAAVPGAVLPPPAVTPPTPAPAAKGSKS